MDLSHVKGVGVSAARKLKKAGIESIEDLARIDLRSTRIEGLSSDHIAKLRANAEAFLEAQAGGGTDLTLVDGLGPSAARKLNRAGVETIEDLANLDLRKRKIEGLSTENLQKLKRNARYLLP